MNQNVVNSEARLAGIGKACLKDAFARNLETSAWVNDGRALAAQLQGHGRQMLCRRLHDDAADERVAGVDDVVPALREEVCGAFFGRLHDGHGSIGEVRAQHVLNRVGTVWRHFGRFDNDGVAGGDGIDHRSNRQLCWVVPRANDQHGPLGHNIHASTARCQRKGD